MKPSYLYSNPRRHLWAAVLSMAFSVSCSDELHILRTDFMDMNQRLRHLTKLVADLGQETHDGFRIALCRPEIGQLIDDVERECKTLSVPIAAAQQQTEPGLCMTKQIQPAVVDLDPEHKGRFLHFMSMLRHESAYLRADSTEFVKIRRDRIERMALQPLLRNTRFLIVAHPVPGEPNKEVEAYKRAQLMVRKLAEYNPAIDESRVRIWVYAFAIARSEIDSPTDFPIPPEPNDLNRTIWVFRADC